MRRQRGFTLIELVIAMVLTVIIAGVAAQVISRPVEAYDQLSRRARLVDAADAALSRIVSEVRGALPNSLRIGCAGSCLEFLQVASGGRYRSGLPGDVLDFAPSSADNRFDVLGPLPNSASLRTGSAADDCRANRADCVAVYNTGQLGANAWNGDNLATLTTVNAPPSARITFHNGGFSSGQPAFPSPSPGQRFQLVSGPIAYLCDASDGSLRRYWGHPIQANQSSVDSHAELTAFGRSRSALLSDHVSSCQFSYTPGNGSRAGLLGLRLVLSETFASGHAEEITLLLQSHIVNVP